MVLRRRSFLKYILLIPTLWLAGIIIFSFRTDSPSTSRSNDDLPVNVVKRAASAPSLVDRIRNVFPFNQLHIDNDHPPEERLKAREQAQEMKAQVQVVAPEANGDDNNPKLGGPGEMGNAVRIKKDKLSQEERKIYDDGWKNNAFNQYVSDMISLRRSLADVRDPE
jgi:hypothetical protein